MRPGESRALRTCQYLHITLGSMQNIILDSAPSASAGEYSYSLLPYGQC